MLTQLRFKNWRSLKDVTIDDLQPINVFIGANSSGKTNIIDALKFRRDSLQKGLVQVVSELGYIKIQTDALSNDEDVEIEFSYKIPISPKPVKETLILEFDKRDMPFKYGRRIFEGNTLLKDDPPRELPLRDVIKAETFDWSAEQQKKANLGSVLSQYLQSLISRRWQILSDSFVPQSYITRREGGDPYVIEDDARNALFMLDFMRQAEPELYSRLEEDLISLVQHVSSMGVLHQTGDNEMELLIREKDGRRAPTISTGTSRLVAILTAIYALDMAQENPNPTHLLDGILTPDLPGLVVIEEPDTALNHGLLKRFVEQLRIYAEGENPRQFILTTHNPYFLDYFEPEEVRVVERDEHGYTSVHRIPPQVKEIWLDKYGLGEVWTTRSFGGVPE